MDKLRLLLICVYTLYEGNDEMTNEFIEQLAAADDVIVVNQDCHFVVGGIPTLTLLKISSILTFQIAFVIMLAYTRRYGIHTFFIK
jgi:ABC-type uncharacterized transport system ATPase subunit